MSDDIIRYDRDFLQAAVCKWRNYSSYSQLRFDDLGNFSKFLGFEPGRSNGSARIVPTHLPEVRHLIDMINGPHGATIIRMLEIRNADNESNSTR